jgi:hypothetical protein
MPKSTPKKQRRASTNPYLEQLLKNSTLQLALFQEQNRIFREIAETLKKLQHMLWVESMNYKTHTVTIVSPSMSGQQLPRLRTFSSQITNHKSEI